MAVEVAAGVCQCANDGHLGTGRVTGRVRLNAGSVGSFLVGGRQKRDSATDVDGATTQGSRVYRIQGQPTVEFSRELEL